MFYLSHTVSNRTENATVVPNTWRFAPSSEFCHQIQNYANLVKILNYLKIRFKLFNVVLF